MTNSYKSKTIKMDNQAKITDLADKLNVNFNKGELITLTVALLQQVFNDDHSKAVGFLDTAIDKREKEAGNEDE